MMGKVTGFALAIAPVLALAACSSGADSDGDGKISREEAAEEAKSVKLNPGKWENKVEIVDVNLDDSKLPPGAEAMKEQMTKAMVGRVTTSSSCLTPEQAAKPEASFLAGADNDKCEYKKFDLSGGKIDAEISCRGDKDGQNGDFTMDGRYDENSYEMTMVMNASSGDMGTMVIKAKSNARRIGDCDD